MGGDILVQLPGADGYAFNSGIGGACRPNDAESVAWWGQFGSIEREKIDKEAYWGVKHLSPPDWGSTDLFYNAHPFFRRGRRSPLFNNSAQIAKLLHSGINENFPMAETSVEDYPGYPFQNQPDSRRLPDWRHSVASATFRPHDKPLVNRYEDIERYDKARSMSYPSSLQRTKSLPSKPSSNISYSSAGSTVASVSLANSKLAIQPYFYGAIPGSRWYQESRKLLDSFNTKRSNDSTTKKNMMTPNKPSTPDSKVNSVGSSGKYRINKKISYANISTNNRQSVRS